MHGEAEAHRKDRLARAPQTVTLKRYVQFGEIRERGWGLGWRDKRAQWEVETSISRVQSAEETVMKRGILDSISIHLPCGQEMQFHHRIPLLPKESLLPVVIAPNDLSCRVWKRQICDPCFSWRQDWARVDGDQRKQSKKKSKEMSCRLWQGNLEKETERASFPPIPGSLPLFPTVNHITRASHL